jgi:dTDP-4-dehydrorhamnose reductase
MKTLCLGDTGSLGREVAKLTTDHAGHLQFDISCRSQVRVILERFKPDVVINCVGLVKSREVPEAAFVEVNALGPWQLRYECDHIGAKLLQVSTDCVFGGKLKYPATYNENHSPTPIDIYGKSKLLGEAGHVNIRSSFIGYGKYGLLQWLTTTSLQVIQGYTNAMWSGLTTPVLAKLLLHIATNIDTMPALTHIHGEYVSKYALLGMLNKRFNLGKVIVPVEKPVINRCLSSVHPGTFEVPMLPDMIAALPYV